VRDFGHHRAADRTMRADVLADGDLRALRGRRTGLGLAHAVELKRAERRETAGREAGASQEGAAIERLGLTLQQTGERAAASLAFCPFDQHGRLLNSDT